MPTELLSCRNAWQRMSDLCADAPVRNFVQTLDMTDYLVETELFPQAVLEAYSAWNLEDEITNQQKTFFSDLRGGGQGDYRLGTRAKIDNIIDCLTAFPQSKRATLTVCNQPSPDHRSDDDAKCLRELHLYLDDDGKLSGTVLFRAQAAMLFPKNIHFIGSIMDRVAAGLATKPQLGSLFYVATILVADRG